MIYFMTEEFDDLIFNSAELETEALQRELTCCYIVFSSFIAFVC